jgi:hypothetical protein
VLAAGVIAAAAMVAALAAGAAPATRVFALTFVLALALAGGLWLGLVPPRWLAASRLARRFGVGLAVTLAAGFVPAAAGPPRVPFFEEGVVGYLLLAPTVLLGAGSAVAAAAGRSFGAGLRASVWAIVLGRPLVIAAWLAKAPSWTRQLNQAARRRWSGRCPWACSARPLAAQGPAAARTMSPLTLVSPPADPPERPPTHRPRYAHGTRQPGRARPTTPYSRLE